jgi:hypothetical protein
MLGRDRLWICPDIFCEKKEYVPCMTILMCSAAAVTSAKERGQAGSTFERGRWSLDGKVGGNAINSKW